MTTPAETASAPAGTSKLPRIEFDPRHVPAALRDRDQWVLWKYELRDGNWTKVPYNARTGRKASSKKPATWCAFETAVAAWKKGGYAGVGYVFSADDPFTGIDLDDCIAQCGKLVDSADEIVNACDSYFEISPGASGVKGFIVASKPKGVRCKSKAIPGFKETEVYSERRFFAVTGRHLPGTPTTVEPRQAQLEALCARLWPKRSDDQQPPTLRLVGTSGSNPLDVDDDALIEKAKSAKNGDAFARLWAGDTSGHGHDDSVADLALCSHLAFWTGGDAARIDRLFRQSGLNREKWNRQDYRDMTIAKALEGCSDFYTPRKANRSGKSGENSTAVRPSILIAPDEHRVVDEAAGTLAGDPDLFQRGGMLVRVQRDATANSGIARHGQSVTIQSVPAANLRDRLTRCATFFKFNKDDEEVDVHPPGWLVAALEARGCWPAIRPLISVADAPILRPDGSICQKPGYDAATSVLMLPGQRFASIAGDVDIDDAHTALQMLLEVVRDFRFESEEHKAGWLAALLTPLARHAFFGPSPMFLIDANVRGAGKGLLAQTIGQIAQGCEMPVSSYSHDAEEMRKKITAIAIAGDRMILLDNLEGTMGNDALDRALTTTRWKDRILGRSEQVDLPLTAVWYATGNNVLVGADTARRIVHIRLDVLEERPELRRDFAHPDLLGWIKENRPQLLIAALTILAAYCRSGRPKADLEAFGSFEGWSDLVRQAVVWLGLPDPCSTRYRLAEVADTTAETLRQLFAAWLDYDSAGEGLVLGKLIKDLYAGDVPDIEPIRAMRTALEELVSTRPGQTPTANQIAARLRHYRRRVIDGHYLEQDKSHRRCGARWLLLPASGDQQLEADDEV